jgi:hypothetical protein
LTTKNTYQKRLKITYSEIPKRTYQTKTVEYRQKKRKKEVKKETRKKKKDRIRKIERNKE